jgi:DNA-directed RNA polymerase specialized sigma24 family protein
MEREANQNLVDDHFGIIVKLSYRYWRYLPDSVKLYLDIDDVIVECVLAVLEKQHRYNPARGAASTFVWHIVRSHCSSIVGRNRAKKRSAVVLPLRELRSASRPCDALQLSEAKKAVEAILADASDGLRRSLTRFLETRRTRVQAHLQEELRMLVRKHNVTYRDLELAFSALL